MSRAPARLRPDDPSARGGVHGLAQAAKRRIAHLAATGLAAGEIAEVEGVEVGHVEALLGDEAFGRLVRAYRVLSAKPDAERRAKLVEIAQFLIDEAIGLGHVRVAFFVVREELHGRDAAETVADKLIKQRAKAAEPSPPARAGAPSAAKPHLPAHPADRMAQRACAQLLKALLHEFRLRAEAVTRAAKRVPAALAAAARLGLPPSKAPRRRLVARLLATAAAIPPLGCPPKLAQAP